MTRSTVVGIDLGKTGCRVRLVTGQGVGHVVEGRGAPGLADAGGVAAALLAVSRLVEEARSSAGLGPADPIDSIMLGAAGAEAAAESARDLAESLVLSLGTDVGVTSDAITAHAGALGGAAGAVVAMGTGAVSIGVGDDGRLCLVDGWGYWLGDDGGGSWIGRQALRAALLAVDGRASHTDLVHAAEQRFGHLSALPNALASQGDVAAVTASFVPDVVRCAEAGDAAAVSVLDSAADLLAAAVAHAAASVDQSTVTAVGGLSRIELLTTRWRRALPDELDVIPAQGASLDGAVLLAQRDDLPHEAMVMRVSRTAAADLASRPTGEDLTPPEGSDPPRTADVDLLATEQVRTDLADLDQRTPQQLVDVLLQAEAGVPDAVRKARVEIASAVSLVEAAFAAGGRLVYVGAGTPGRLAALDAAECPPTFGTAPDRVIALLAGGADAASSAVEGAEDDAEAGARDVRGAEVSSRDVVVGISASGRTPYVLAALEAARDAGAPTVAIVNNRGSLAATVADLTIELDTGPEVLSGSTRLKSGTSEKVVLNTISTSAMVRTGKSYGAWMVDVQATNEKLRRRACRIVREAAAVDAETALRTLAAADWNTKTALVALLADVDVDEAQRRLDLADGRVRAAVGAGRVVDAP